MSRSVPRWPPSGHWVLPPERRPFAVGHLASGSAQSLRPSRHPKPANVPLRNPSLSSFSSSGFTPKSTARPARGPRPAASPARRHQPQNPPIRPPSLENACPCCPLLSFCPFLFCVQIALPLKKNACPSVRSHLRNSLQCSLIPPAGLRIQDLRPFQKPHT